MMENNEIIQTLHKVNTEMKVLMQDLSEVIDNLSKLTELVYDKEIKKLDDEINNINTNIKLRSHM